MIRTSRRALLGAASLFAAPGVVGAQPIQRPVRLVIGFPPGGSSDIVGRIYAERLRGLYAPQVIIDSRPGAAGRIGVEAVKAAPPDGETILQTPASMLTLQPSVFPKQVRYDALADLIPVSTTVAFPFVLAVPANHPAQDLAGFVAWAKRQSDISYASSAAGSAPHFIGVMLGRAIGATMTHVSYRGGGPAMQDLMAGRIQAFFGVLGEVAPHDGHGLRVLAVSAPQRVARFPAIPTFAESGFPQLTKDEWFGLLLPAGTPQPIVTGLFDAIRRAAADPGLREALAKLEFDAVTSESPAAFAEKIRRERQDWAAVVKESGVNLDD